MSQLNCENGPPNTYVAQHKIVKHHPNTQMEAKPQALPDCLVQFKPHYAGFPYIDLHSALSDP